MPRCARRWGGRAAASLGPAHRWGKSFGGRMTSQAQALAPLPNVLGLAFVGFPLHPAGRPSIERAMHLSAISIPMLCLQGTRDALAELSLIRATIADLEQLATLSIIEGADHAFHVLARSGRTDAQAMSEMLENLVVWAGVTVGNNPSRYQLPTSGSTSVRQPVRRRLGAAPTDAGSGAGDQRRVIKDKRVTPPSILPASPQLSVQVPPSGIGERLVRVGLC